MYKSPHPRGACKFKIDFNHSVKGGFLILWFADNIRVYSSSPLGDGGVWGA